MNIFATLHKYATKWEIKSERDFTEEEIKMVNSAEVVPSNYGNSVCFNMVGGGMTFIPLSSDSTLTEGQTVDLTKAKLLTLGKEGEADINRIKA